MKNISRNFTNKVNYILDHIVPPCVRDSEKIMHFLFFIVLGKKCRYYMEFKEKAHDMADTEVDQYYSLLSDTFMERETDCNSGCEEYILNHIYGDTILDVGGAAGI